MDSEMITLAHGGGGRQTQRLIDTIFRRYFTDPALSGDDSAVVSVPEHSAYPTHLAITTDSFVVQPIFFRGGDIGTLAVTGTVNDLLAAGAEPRWLTAGFILEEGLSLADLERIVCSMACSAAKAGVAIVAGDTKVVPRGAADRIFINTSGIGLIACATPPRGDAARGGDAVIVSGPVGDHGTAILLERGLAEIESELQSDCAPLTAMVLPLLRDRRFDLHVLRDPTRGGLATALNEIAQASRVGIEIDDTTLPLRPAVRAVASLTGMDPLYHASEGRMIFILPEVQSEMLLADLRNSPLGVAATRIGRVHAEHPGKVLLRTVFGSRRILEMLSGELLPRIC